MSFLSLQKAGQSVKICHVVSSPSWHCLQVEATFDIFDWWYINLLCPVINCTMCPSCTLLRLKRFLDFLLSITGNHNLVCLYSSFLFLSVHLWVQPFSIASLIFLFAKLIGDEIITLLCALIVPSFASESANSLPEDPLCPLTHFNSTFLVLASSLSLSMHFSTVF